ncbi:MAG: transposase family protein [bacterium]|nr:transposase family protein [bacterium]
MRFWVRVGFRLRAATEDDGELLVLAETTASVVGCSGCGTRARWRGRRRTRVRDLPVGGRPTVLVWSKRLWRCPEAACSTKSWSETSPLIRPRAVLSERARREAARRVGEDGVSVAAAARSLGVGWSTVMEAVREFGEPLVEEHPGSLAGVRSLGTGRAPVEVPPGSVGNRIRGSRVGPAAR